LHHSPFAIRDSLSLTTRRSPLAVRRSRVSTLTSLPSTECRGL
jgi:hypothetical protein